MVNPDITILMQGILEERTIETLEHYAKSYPFVLSVREDSPLELVHRAARIKGQGTVVLYQTEIPPDVTNQQKIHLHVKSMETALRWIETPFVIKTRADEYFEDFSPFVEKSRTHRGAFISSDIFFRSTKQMPFHPSYHLFGMETVSLIKMVGTVRERLTNNRLHAPNGKDLCTEMLFGLSFLETRGVRPDWKNPAAQMRDHFQIVPIRELGKVRWTWLDHDRGRQWMETPEVENVLGLSISTLNDLERVTQENQSWS